MGFNDGSNKSKPYQGSGSGKGGSKPTDTQKHKTAQKVHDVMNPKKK